MGQKRYNSLSVLNACTDIVDNLSLIEVAERFATAKERSRNEFGTVTEKHLHFFYFFLFFKKSRKSRNEILIIVSIFKRPWVVLRASRNQNFLRRPTMMGDIFLRKIFICLAPPLEITCCAPGIMEHPARFLSMRNARKHLTSLPSHTLQPKRILLRTKRKIPSFLKSL